MYLLKSKICIYPIGWQYRWFTVDPQTGTLSYYICENNAEGATPPNLTGSTPRWQEHLAGAAICPSDEDSRTFTIGTANGDTLKLRANDARARQEWVDVLRNIAECHTQVSIFVVVYVINLYLQKNHILSSFKFILFYSSRSDHNLNYFHHVKQLPHLMLLVKHVNSFKIQNFGVYFFRKNMKYNLKLIIIFIFIFAIVMQF